MRLFDEFLNLDGKDADLPLLNSEERLPTEPATANATTHSNIHEAPDWATVQSAVWTTLMESMQTPPQMTPWSATPWTSAHPEAHPKDAMDWSDILLHAAGRPQAEGVNSIEWMIDTMFPIGVRFGDVGNSNLPPMSAGSTVFATPSATPALLVEQLDSTSPEYDAVSPMFAPSTNVSPAFNTSPTFGGECSLPTFEADEAFVGEELLQVAPTNTSSSSSSSLSADIDALQLLQTLKQEELHDDGEEPSVSIPTRILASLIERVKACTCHPPSSISTISSIVSTALSPTVATSERPVAVDPFAARRRRVPTKLYVCSHHGCAKTFTRKFNLQTHEETHNPHRPREHTCDQCGKRFTRSHDLTRHAAVHDDEKHECVGCGKAYSRSDALRRHMGKCESLDADYANANASGVRKQITPTLVTLR